VKIPIKEEHIQRAIIDGLTALHYTVLQTTVRGVRMGYGSSKGVPDLLITHNSWQDGCWLGIEVKGPNTKLSLEQRLLEIDGRIQVARSWEDAIRIVKSFSNEQRRIV